MRELKTSTGKILTKTSEYTLVEKKKIIDQGGKKQKIDYVFELDLKEEEKEGETEEMKVKAAAEAAENVNKNLFYLNLDDFSLVKLRAAVFLVDWPLSFTICIVQVWQKTLPQQSNLNDLMSAEDIQQISKTRTDIKEFNTKLTEEVQNLLDYIMEYKKANKKPMRNNFS